MKKLVMMMVASLWLAGVAWAQEPAASDPKQLWQLLDYVAVDYGGAVAKGAVLSEGEYAEMLDFTENAGKQATALPAHASKAELVSAVKALREAVHRKADAEEVARLAHQANALLIASYPVPVAPKTFPALERGPELYATNCSSCHGAAGHGNGALAAKLDPKPIDFTDRERARSRSLMALYQVMTQGVEGTSMRSFSELSEDDRWALAFHVGSLSYDKAAVQRGEQIWNNDSAIKARFPDLASLTTTTESAAAGTMSAEAARDVTAYLRAHPTALGTGNPGALTLARQKLHESLAAMQSGDRSTATKLALSAYLDGFEPLEPTVGARNKSLLTAVEDAMLKYRSAITKGSQEEAKAAAVLLERLFVQVDTELGEAQADPMTTFVGAMTILLREGVEALLIVIGMIAFLKKAQRNDVLRYVHGGWVSALAGGVMTWVVATYLVAISGASREVTEGVGSVFAAIVLLSVGLWMHQKSSAGRWQAYLHDKLSAAMTRRSAWALFALSFIAVYREVFETVLFYSALAADGNGTALLGGFLTAVVLLGVIAWALLRTSARMPIGKFFSITSILVAVLAVILIGKGMAGMQEAGWVGVTPIATPRLAVLGIYPTLETVLSQVLVMAIALLGFGFNHWSARKIQAA